MNSKSWKNLCDGLPARVGRYEHEKTVGGSLWRRTSPPQQNQTRRVEAAEKKTVKGQWKEPSTPDETEQKVRRSESCP